MPNSMGKYPTTAQGGWMGVGSGAGMESSEEKPNKTNRGEIEKTGA
jgi:hypothetical protein